MSICRSSPVGALPSVARKRRKPRRAAISCCRLARLSRLPAWVTYGWPDEHARALAWQWKEKVIPYWKQAAAFARQHGIHRLAFEMHPNFVVYNPMTLLKLREAVGEEIGAKRGELAGGLAGQPHGPQGC